MTWAQDTDPAFVRELVAERFGPGVPIRERYAKPLPITPTAEHRDDSPAAIQRRRRVLLDALDQAA